MTGLSSSSFCPASHSGEAERRDRRAAAAQALQDVWTGCACREGEGSGRPHLEPAVTCTVLVSSGERWTINKGPQGPSHLPKGLWLQPTAGAEGGAKRTSKEWGFVLCPAPQCGCVTAVVRWVRWVCRFWGCSLRPSRGGMRRGLLPRGCRDQGSDLHERDLEAFQHALHVEDEGVLI